jgi:hypothetical protein
MLDFPAAEVSTATVKEISSNKLEARAVYRTLINSFILALTARVSIPTSDGV